MGQDESKFSDNDAEENYSHRKRRYSEEYFEENHIEDSYDPEYSNKEVILHDPGIDTGEDESLEEQSVSSERENVGTENVLSSTDCDSNGKRLEEKDMQRGNSAEIKVPNEVGQISEIANSANTPALNVENSSKDFLLKEKKAQMNESTPPTNVSSKETLPKAENKEESDKASIKEKDERKEALRRDLQEQSTSSAVADPTDKLAEILTKMGIESENSKQSPLSSSASSSTTSSASSSKRSSISGAVSCESESTSSKARASGVDSESQSDAKHEDYRQISSAESVVHINSIIIQGQYFLKALATHGNYCKISKNLIDVLDSILVGVDQLIDMKTKDPIDKEDESKIFNANSCRQIRNSFICVKCHTFIGNCAQDIAVHLGSDHQEGKKSRKDKQKASEQGNNNNQSQNAKNAEQSLSRKAAKKAKRKAERQAARDREAAAEKKKVSSSNNLNKEAIESNGAISKGQIKKIDSSTYTNSNEKLKESVNKKLASTDTKQGGLNGKNQNQRDRTSSQSSSNPRDRTSSFGSNSKKSDNKRRLSKEKKSDDPKIQNLRQLQRHLSSEHANQVENMQNQIQTADHHQSTTTPLNHQKKPEEKQNARQRNRRRHEHFQSLPKKARSLINNNMQSFFVQHVRLGQTLKYIAHYDIIEQQLMESLRLLYPGQPIKIYKFGSRMSGIGCRDSDLDLYVDIDNSFNRYELRPSPYTSQKVSKLYQLLNAGKDWKQLIPIKNARVPILKSYNVATGISCDIGFSNSLGYCNTKLIDYLLDLQPIGRCMCVFIKKWLERSKLNDKYNLNSYCLILMVIYYLQVNKFLPSVQKLQMPLETKLYVGPWVGNFMEKSLKDFDMKEIDVNAQTVKMILQSFFEFYDEFPYETNVISPYYGMIDVSRDKIELLLPKRYLDFVHSVDDARLQLDDKPMVVQDPLELNHNVTKSVTPGLLKVFKQFVHDTVRYFKEL